MNYQEALDYLFSQLPMFSRTGAPAYKPGLDTSVALAAYFGNPQDKFKSIHIAGTNGKGSTSHLIASILQSQGYKVGLYTSPHLVDFRERMRINGKMISEERVINFVETWKSSSTDQLAPQAQHPSFFELTMIMAFQWFAEEKVDYAVIEVGMGGRLDSTNIITPLLSVITNISWDHNQFLGDTLEKIAAEKAGIIKKGIPVVIGETQPESAPVFKEKAKEAATTIQFADQSDHLPGLTKASEVWIVKYDDKKFILPLGGDYQKKNIVTVLGAILKLKDLGIEISGKAIVNGVENVCKQTGLAGRWMILSREPLIIADTGHNIAGLSFNFTQLSNLVKERTLNKLRIVIGFVADKAIDKILEILPRDAVYYVTNASIPRALPAKELINKFKSVGLQGTTYTNVAEAYLKAKEEASNQDIIFIGGSTFIVADLLNSNI